jgi:hypothetical protein
MWKRVSFFTLLLMSKIGFSEALNKHFSCPKHLVLVTGYAKSFIGDHYIQDADVHVLNTPLHTITNNQGIFSFCLEPGKYITLELSKRSSFPFENYHTTQIGTFIVPYKGFSGEQNELTFQVPREITYKLFKKIIMSKQHLDLLPQTCQVATTVTAFGKTLKDDLQGEPGARIILSQNGKTFVSNSIYYFGVLFKKTNPFTTNTHCTSSDGGVLIANLPASKTLYKLTAEKNGKQFSSEYFLCRPNTFINLSPPHGIKVIN